LFYNSKLNENLITGNKKKPGNNDMVIKQTVDDYQTYKQKKIDIPMKQLMEAKSPNRYTDNITNTNMASSRNKKSNIQPSSTGIPNQLSEKKIQKIKMPSHGDVKKLMSNNAMDLGGSINPSRNGNLVGSGIAAGKVLNNYQSTNSLNKKYLSMLKK
jgi:hypothetical protein